MHLEIRQKAQKVRQALNQSLSRPAFRSRAALAAVARLVRRVSRSRPTAFSFFQSGGRGRNCRFVFAFRRQGVEVRHGVVRAQEARG